MTSAGGADVPIGTLARGAKTQNTTNESSLIVCHQCKGPPLYKGGSSMRPSQFFFWCSLRKSSYLNYAAFTHSRESIDSGNVQTSHEQRISLIRTRVLYSERLSIYGLQTFE
jgi:hypothetical protein